MENIAGEYLTKLKNSSTPGVDLVHFLCEMFGLTPKSSQYAMMNKLIKLYGRNLVFYAVTDMYWVENIDLSKSLFPLLRYFCKKRFKNDNSESETSSLEDIIALLQKSVKTTKIKISDLRCPFDEQDE